jgi:transposase
MCAISSAGRRDGARRLCGRLGVDEIYLGKNQKFLKVVSNLQSGEPVWFGWERKQETLDRFFQQELSSRQRHGIEAACVGMHEPFRLSLEAWAPQRHLIYDKFHVMQPANEAVTEVRRAEFFRQGRRCGNE